ncbi:hypothetical protein ACIQWZ_39835 [Streptomyces sp. NPDC098077]|uniref:hypothetical protein n=1 Tax=Streptomyces sp. NPDC098077 TaxID=3366093 RepID=UPI003808038E
MTPCQPAPNNLIPMATLAAAVIGMLAALASILVTRVLARRREQHEFGLEEQKRADGVKTALQRQRFEQAQTASPHIVGFTGAVNAFMYAALGKIELLHQDVRWGAKELEELSLKVAEEGRQVRHWVPEIAPSVLDIEKLCVRVISDPPDSIELGTPACKGWYNVLIDRVGERIALFEALNLNHR